MLLSLNSVTAFVLLAASAFITTQSANTICSNHTIVHLVKSLNQKTQVLTPRLAIYLQLHLRFLLNNCLLILNCFQPFQLSHTVIYHQSLKAFNTYGISTWKKPFDSVQFIRTIHLFYLQ